MGIGACLNVASLYGGLMVPTRGGDSCAALPLQAEHHPVARIAFVLSCTRMPQPFCVVSHSLEPFLLVPHHIHPSPSSFTSKVSRAKISGNVSRA